ncbi:MAG TPA: glycosyltransferase family 1 protein [Herpetosiphonaceae bacterium]
MRIGFDATAIPHNRTGAGNYIFNLVQALAQIDRSNDYAIFARPDHIGEFGIDQPNVQFWGVDLTSRPVRLAWEQVGLPWNIRRLKLDLLHSPHYTMPIPRLCKSVVTFCDMTFYLLPEMHSPSKRMFFQRMMRWSARHADRLIAISESTQRDVIRLLNVRPERIVATPLAASPDYRPLPQTHVAPVCARYDLTPGQYIYYVGVLEPRKNIPALIEAYATIAAEFPHVPLVIAGKKGWMYDEIFKRVVELGLEQQIRFLGYIPDDDVIPLYNGARVFVYPSRYEGFGLPVLEAMQCGVPVITTNVSSMPEVADGAALLVPPGEIPALAAALREVLTDDELARDLARRGLARAAHFSWRRCAAETLEVYQSLG